MTTNKMSTIASRVGLWGVLTAAFSMNAPAADLKNFITDLYGGDGITLDVFGAFPHAAHFTQGSLERLSALNASIASGVGSFAFNSTVSSYTFDVESGAPVRSVESLGPILAERAETVGKGKFNFALSYAHVKFDEFDGQDIKHIHLVFPHLGVDGPPPVPAFKRDTVEVDLNLDIAQDVLAMFGTYGITDQWDVGIILPLVHTRVRAVAVAQIVDHGGGPAFHRFGVLGDSPTDVTGGSATGVGDVVLRSKYQFVKNQGSLPDMAARFQVTTPSGNDADLLGTGETAFEGMFITSKKLGIFTPHFNVGYEATTNSNRDNLRYTAGFDARVVPEKLTAAVELLGRHYPHADATSENFLDVAFGLKWDPFGAVPINANFIIPINHDGLRSDLIWSVGIDYSF